MAIATPSSRIARMVSNSCSAATGDSPADGSSSISTTGSTISAMAMASICRWPPDRVRAAVRRRSASIGKRSNAAAIKSNEGWGTVTVEGHCDERGSEEYNLALGDRRANAVRRYLIDLGVPASRLRTVSFGEARPAVPGHDENAWRYNRRAEFKSGA